MKELTGITHNLSGEILGVITKKGRNIFSRKNYILVSDEFSNVKSGYAGTITTRFLNSQNPHIQVASLDGFEDGDVVSINTDGRIVFLYERNSSHNAILVTELCNHRCIMCPQPPVTKEVNRTQFNKRLIKLFDKSTREIGLTGGEPTMLGDELFELIHSIQKYTPKAAISILSNGVRFADLSYARKLAQCNHFDLQVDIPIFSDIPAEHNKIVGAQTFYKTVQGLYNLAKLRVRIGIRMVIHKQTYKRLPQFAEYIYRNFPFVSQVAFMQMEMMGLALNNQNEVWIDPYEYQSELEQAVLHLANRKMNPLVFNAQLCVLPESIRQYAYRSISSWKDIYIDECSGCTQREQCAGFFSANKNWHSKHICKFSV